MNGQRIRSSIINIDLYRMISHETICVKKSWQPSGGEHVHLQQDGINQIRQGIPWNS